jgi:transposase
MKLKSEANNGLLDFINNDGIPEWLVVDGAIEQGGGQNTAWRSSLKIYHIKQTYMKPYSPWQNRAEGEIQEMKRDIKKLTREKNSPRQL